jgi:allophanate hydrolase
MFARTKCARIGARALYFAVMRTDESFLIADLLRAYRAKLLTPTEVVESALARADQSPDRHVWITRLSREDLLEYARAIERRSIDELPLYGIPFVIKDNIDQFATGLVGTRSPYGACQNSFNSDFISGGSSSGSAVAVATGLASFALGTDTAGSGRVPAAFNNIIGFKPSVGRISTRGVVPACRSLDCVSIFSMTSEDAARVLAVAEGYDAEEAYSRRLGHLAIEGQRFGVPRSDQLQFFGDGEYARLFDQAIARIESLGGSLVRVDFAPFLEAGRLLYEGPWVAERYAAVGDFIHLNASAVHPVTRQVIESGKAPSGVEVFRAQYQLMALRRACEKIWDFVDVIITPTAGTIYERARVDADPIRLNMSLGYYTNFMNLLDLAGVAIPAGFRNDGLPFGVTIIGRCATDRALLALAGRLHRAYVSRLGAVNWPMPASAENSCAAPVDFTGSFTTQGFGSANRRRTVPGRTP